MLAHPAEVPRTAHSEIDVLLDRVLHEQRWGGAYGHAWFVDPVRALSVVAFTNTLYEGMSGRFVTELRDAMYANRGMQS